MPEQAPDRHAAEQAPDRHAADRRTAEPDAARHVADQDAGRPAAAADAGDPRTVELIRRLLRHDADAPAEILARSATSTSPGLLVAAAILADRPSPAIDRAQRCAATTRDRQLVALAAARLAGDGMLLDALVRDHLADHPDDSLAAWIADPDAVSGRA